MKPSDVTLCNNTNEDLRIGGFDKIILDCVYNGRELPEEISDIFKLTVLSENVRVKAIVNWM